MTTLTFSFCRRAAVTSAQVRDYVPEVGLHQQAGYFAELGLRAVWLRAFSGLVEWVFVEGRFTTDTF